MDKVGVHSFRNVRQLSRWRKLWWVSLVAIGIPIQLFFHSSTFILYTSTTYSVLIASEAFTTGADLVYPGVAFLDLTAYNSTTEVQSYFYDTLPGFRAASMNWTRLEVQDCMHTYFQDPMGICLTRHQMGCLGVVIFTLNTRPWLSNTAYRIPIQHLVKFSCRALSSSLAWSALSWDPSRVFWCLTSTGGRSHASVSEML